MKLSRVYSSVHMPLIAILFTTANVLATDLPQQNEKLAEILKHEARRIASMPELKIAQEKAIQLFNDIEQYSADRFNELESDHDYSNAVIALRTEINQLGALYGENNDLSDEEREILVETLKKQFIPENFKQ